MKKNAFQKLAHVRKLATERQRRRRANLAQNGLKSIQGIIVPVELHDQCKDACIKACAEICNGRSEDGK